MTDKTAGLVCGERYGFGTCQGGGIYVAEPLHCLLLPALYLFPPRTETHTQSWSVYTSPKDRQTDRQTNSHTSTTMPPCIEKARAIMRVLAVDMWNQKAKHERTRLWRMYCSPQIKAYTPDGGESTGYEEVCRCPFALLPLTLLACMRGSQLLELESIANVYGSATHITKSCAPTTAGTGPSSSLATSTSSATPSCRPGSSAKASKALKAGPSSPSTPAAK